MIKGLLSIIGKRFSKPHMELEDSDFVKKLKTASQEQLSLKAEQLRNAEKARKTKKEGGTRWLHAHIDKLMMSIKDRLDQPQLVTDLKEDMLKFVEENPLARHFDATDTIFDFLENKGRYKEIKIAETDSDEEKEKKKNRSTPLVWNGYIPKKAILKTALVHLDPIFRVDKCSVYLSRDENRLIIGWS